MNDMYHAREARRRGCKACSWFSEVAHEKGMGECRAAPPRTSTVRFPAVDETDWCGAWVEAGPRPGIDFQPFEVRHEVRLAEPEDTAADQPYLYDPRKTDVHWVPSVREAEPEAPPMGEGERRAIERAYGYAPGTMSMERARKLKG